MKLQKVLWLVVAMVAYGNGNDVWAYGSDASAKTADHCMKVVVSDFNPPPFSRETNNVEVKPGSNFSFLISREAKMDTIKVSVKGESIPTTVTSQQNGMLVKGKLPQEIKGKYIRVEIAAKGPNECDRNDAWLLKIGN
ncbi:MAG: hypothetical protein OEY86_12065 [Nitrospira sp.]|nr:hypothetical protein [Nitrospira sp.]